MDCIAVWVRGISRTPSASGKPLPPYNGNGDFHPGSSGLMHLFPGAEYQPQLVTHLSLLPPAITRDSFFQLSTLSRDFHGQWLSDAGLQKPNLSSAFLKDHHRSRAPCSIIGGLIELYFMLTSSGQSCFLPFLTVMFLRYLPHYCYVHVPPYLNLFPENLD